MDAALALEIELRVDGKPVASSTLVRPAGANVLTISTSIPRPDLALTLHSTYTGAPLAPTHVVHLQLARHRPVIEHATFADDDHPERSMVAYWPQHCATDHVARLMDWLGQLGHQLQADLGDSVTTALQAAH